jgi:hypothetical protein
VLPERQLSRQVRKQICATSWRLITADSNEKWDGLFRRKAMNNSKGDHRPRLAIAMLHHKADDIREMRKFSDPDFLTKIDSLPFGQSF